MKMTSNWSRQWWRWEKPCTFKVIDQQIIPWTETIKWQSKQRNGRSHFKFRWSLNCWASWLLYQLLDFFTDSNWSVTNKEFTNGVAMWLISFPMYKTAASALNVQLYLKAIFSCWRSWGYDKITRTGFESPLETCEKENIMAEAGTEIVSCTQTTNVPPIQCADALGM